MGWKAKIGALLGPEGYIAGKYLEMKNHPKVKKVVSHFKKMPKATLAVGAGVAGGAAAATIAAGRATRNAAAHPIYQSQPIQWDMHKLGTFAMILLFGFLAIAFLPLLGIDRTIVIVVFLAILLWMFLKLVSPTAAQKAIIGGFFLLALFGLYLLLNYLQVSTIMALLILGSLLTLLISYNIKRGLFDFLLIVLGYFLGFILLSYVTFSVPIIPSMLTTIYMIVFTLAILFAKMKGGAKVAIIFFTVFGPLFLIGNYQSLFQADSPMYNSLEDQISNWRFIFDKTTKSLTEDLPKLGAELGIGAKRQLAMLSGDYEDGVEAQSKVPVGVFLENTIVEPSTVRETGTINLATDLRAATFDKTIEVALSCKIGNVEGEIIPSNKLTMVSQDIESIDCLIPASKVGGTGIVPIKLIAKFPFTTSGYLKTYFMDKDILREYRKRQEDPLASFGVTQTQTDAIYTGGPLKIGLGVGKQPIGLTSSSSAAGTTNYGPTLKLTLDKNWAQGKLEKINSLTITMPPGLIAKKVAGQDYPTSACNAVSTTSTSGLSGVEQQCKFTGEFLDTIFPPNTQITSFRIQTEIQDKNKVLAGQQLSIASFKVQAKYEYTIETTGSVTIKSAVTT